MRTKAARGLVSTTVVIVTLVLMGGMAYAQTDRGDIEKRLAIIKEQCKKGFFSQEDCKEAKKKVLDQLVSGGQGSQPPAKPTGSQPERQGEPAFVSTRSVVPISAQTPSIEGTYRLVSRTLPDGTVLRPPDIIGLLTYTKDHRNFHYFWKDATGKCGVVFLLATYTLTAAHYSETQSGTVPIYNYPVNDLIGPNDIATRSALLGGFTNNTPVKMEGGRIQFKSLFRPFSQVFEGNKMTTTYDGIAEVWEKVP